MWQQSNVRSFLSLALVLGLAACDQLSPTGDQSRLAFIGGGQFVGMVVPASMSAADTVKAARSFCHARRPCAIIGSRDIGKAALSQTRPDPATADCYYAIDGRGAETIQFYCAEFPDARQEWCHQH